MSALLSHFQTFGAIAVIVIIVLYIITIIWVVKDAPARGYSPVKWGIIALIPFIGALMYSAMRPSMLAADKEEQELDYLLRQRELMQYGECGRCSYPVQNDYVMCPNCGSRLKNVCAGCGRPLNPQWTVCPWCCTKAQGKPSRRPQGAGQARPRVSGGNRSRSAADAGYDSDVLRHRADGTD